jgi:maleylpyruvate isomerase
MRGGTDLVERLVGELTGHSAAAPSILPGWTRGHVASHLANNADAVANLLAWATTGTERPMYASPARRAADIDAGARLPAGELAALLRIADQRLERAVAAMSARDWAATVRTPTGREIPAGEAVWLRAREVWVHATDLDLGCTFADLPAGFLDELLTDVAQTLAQRPDAAPACLHSTDSGCRWWLSIFRDDVVIVTGPTAALTAWVLGRAPGDGLRVHPPGPLPQIGAWL